MSDQPEPANRPQPPVSSVPGVQGLLLQRGLISAPLHPGQVGCLDHYQLVCGLGEGGMGIVLKALDSRNGMEVALKMLRPELAAQPQQVHRFLKEARHMRRLRHPSILSVLDVSEDSGKAYFVMPLMKRGSLVQQLSEQHPLSEEESLSIARQVAAALAHAHSKSVTHRDLKPGNVLLDETGNAVLADFGLARTLFNDSVVDAAKGEIGEGTPHYMSPQLARGESEDTRCDIYALGALLYEMLTGRPPYEGQSTAQILEKIRHGPPRPLLALRPKLSLGIAKVVEGAMAREQRDRYANMSDLLADLERLEKGLAPVGAHVAFSLRRMVGDRKVLLAAATCACLALIATVAFLDWRRTSYALRTDWTLSLPQIPSWTAAQLGDWDGSGEPEIVKLSGNTLHVYSLSGRALPTFPLEKPADAPGRLGLLADVNNDGLAEALISWTVGTNAHVGAFNKSGWPIKDYRFPGTINVNRYYGTNFTWLGALRMADLDGNGRQALLVSVGSTWALHPRGIACFDVETTRLKWFFETANFITGVELCDLDGDGRQELVLGSNTPGNYPPRVKLPDGTDDQRVNLYVLSADGKLRWMRELGGVFASVRPLPRKATHRSAVVWVSKPYIWSQLHKEPEAGRIIEFDAYGKVTHQHDFKRSLTSAFVTDLERDGCEDILAADRTGALHVLNANLEVEQSVQVVSNKYAEVDLQIQDAGPFGPSRNFNVVVTSSQIDVQSDPTSGNNREKVERIFYRDNRILLLDAQLRTVASYLVAEKWSEAHRINARLVSPDPGQPARLLSLSDKIQLLSLVKAEKRRSNKSE